MRGFGLFLLASAPVVFGADRTTVTKYIPAPTGPWTETLAINLDYPYGAQPADPVAFSAADGLAFQAGDVLTIQYDSGLWCAGTYVSPTTCVDGNGYRNYAPIDDHPLGTSAVYAPSKYMGASAYPVYLMQLVGTFADARGQIVGVPFKVGNGPINVTIPAGAVRLQLGANLYDYTSARDYYTVLKASVSGTTLKSAGTMAHLAVGGSWKTTIVLQNSSARQAQAQLNFFDDSGNAAAVPVSFPPALPSSAAAMSTVSRTMAAGAALTIVCGGVEGQAQLTGWSQLITDGSVSGFAIFGSKSGTWDQEAVVPLETRNANSYILWFDTTGSMVVGVAVANTTAQPVTVDATIRDEGGQVVGTGQVPLAAQGHSAFDLAARMPQAAQRRGTVEFHTAATGQITVLGFRFNPLAFTTIPVMTK